MHKSLATLILASIVSLVTTFSHASQPVTLINVTDNILMLQGKGGNIGFSTGADGTFMVDDQYAEQHPRILAALKGKNIAAPHFLINTHWHGDHTGGNELFAQQGAIVVAHENVRKRMSTENFLSAFNAKVPPAPEKALPVITFTQNINFHMNGEMIKVLHMDQRGHTDGDSAIFFTKSNVLHTGDLFFNGFYPFIDTAHGGSLKGMIATSTALLNMTDNQTKIIPGHGPLASRNDLAAYRDMLQTAHNKLAPLKAEGLSAVQAAAKKPLSELDKEWGDGLFTSDKWINVVYPNL